MDFQEFFLLLSDTPYGKVILSVLTVIFGFVVMIIQIKKYRLSSKQAKELNDMKYRTENYQEKNKPDGQTFSATKPEYHLDERTNTLKEIGKIDLQEVIQSSVDCALDRVLAKYDVYPQGMLPKADPTDEVFVSDASSDIDYMAQMFEDFEEMKLRYNLPADVSYSQMFDIINQKRDEVSKRIQSKQQEVIDNGKVSSQENK